MTFITIFATLGLIAVASAKVTVKPAPNVTVYHKDLLQFNVSELFDFGANVTCDSLSGSIAKYTTPNDELETKDISMYHFAEEPEIVQIVTNTSVFAVFDNSSVLIQQITLDHEAFGVPISKSFGRPGAEAVCTDVAYNKRTDRIFISCFSKQSKSTPNSTLWVYELDAATGDTVGHYSNMLDDDVQKIVHRANIMLVPVKRGAGVEWAVIVYDQGISSGIVDNNKWVWLLAGADTDALADLGVLNVDNIKLASVYDMFAYRDGILVTGKASKEPNAKINLALCRITIAGKASIDCGDTLVASPFNTTTGYVGIFNTGQYVEVNADAENKDYDTIFVCNFQGDFGTPAFIDKDNCNSMPSYQIPDDVSISVVEGNIHQLVIQYVHFDSTYAGYSHHNFDLLFETKYIDDQYAYHLVPLGKSIIRVNRTELGIYRMVRPYFLIKADELKDGFNSIRVECKDLDTLSPVATFINVTKLASMTDGVYINEDKIHSFSVYDGGQFMFQLDSDIMMGNDLSVRVKFDSKVANFTTAQVYDTEFININWRVTNSSTQFNDVHFSGKYAVTLDKRGWVSFHRCKFLDIAALECVEAASYNLAGHDLVVKKDVNSVFGWLFAWGYDKDLNVTFIFIFDGSNLYTHIRQGAADDCAMTEVGEYAYQICAFTDAGEIRGYQYSQLNPQMGIQMPTITQSMSARDFFCPVDIDFDPRVSNILEILSVCPGKDQRILRYTYPPTTDRNTGKLTVNLISSVPLNFAFQNPQYCSMGTEFVVFSKVNGKRGDIQSFNTVDDLNSWNFGTLLDDLALGDITDFNCIPRAGIFSTVSADPDDPSKVTLAVYWGNNQWQANHKVYNTRRSGLDMYKFIDSYEFAGQVIHTLYNPSTHSYDYMLSFTDGPLVDVRFAQGAVAAVDAKGEVGMQIEVRNMKQMAETINKRVEIVSTDATVKVNTKKKLESNPSGIIELEDYIEIKGPVVDATLKNRSVGLDLIGRLHVVSLYQPKEIDYAVYSHFETFRTVSVGVKTSPSNSSVFTIFKGIDNYIGSYVPSYGVNAFHLATLNSDQNNCILIAYSTAEPYGNSLQLVLLNGTTILATTRATGQLTTFNYSSIKVIPLTTAGSDKFIVLAMNSGEHVIHHFSVTYQNKKLTAVDTNKVVENCHDFTWASPDSSQVIYVIYNIQADYSDVEFETFDKSTGLLTADSKMIKKPFFNQGLKSKLFDYQIWSLFAKNHNSTSFYIVFNTNSPFIFEFIYDTANIGYPQTFKYMKLPGHEGRYMDGNHQNIVILTTGDLPSGDAGARYVFYNRQCQTNNGSIHAIWTYYNDIPRPFTLTNCPANNSHFQFASPFDTVPVIFLKVARMQLNITDNTRLQYAVLEIDSAAHVEATEIKITDIIDAGSDSKKSMAWWPFVLVIGVLILLAVAFIIYKAQKDKAMESDDPENYVSLKPDAKDAKTDRESQ